MPKPIKIKALLYLGCATAIAMPLCAAAQDFSIPAGDLKQALDAYRAQTGTPLVVSSEAIRGIHTGGVAGDLSADRALSHILSGTGFVAHRDPSGMIAIIRSGRSSDASDVMIAPLQLAQAAPARAAVETVTVTSSKLGGADVQSIPIAITALSQEQLTATQTAGGPDLVKQVPNLTFTKTNFTGYSINIRGIGTQAISVTTDPAVAVALNDVPFIRNHFFEQEFYDVGQLEVLRGPQGTLYGRNATGGVVNLVTAKPTDQFEAMASGELGNYGQRRFEGMLNIPLVDDRLDIRMAGEWTKRQGYSYNSLTDQRIDGRDLWSGRLTIAVKPIAHMQTTLIWEHFSENDDRMRSSKQLCHRAPDPTEIGGKPIDNNVDGPYDNILYVNQGCVPDSLYSPNSFQVTNGYSLTYFSATKGIGNPVNPGDPYAGAVNSPNLRVIESTLDPVYKAKNDIFELNTDYQITPELTFSSQTAFNHDFLWSTEDYNRFNTTPGVFDQNDDNGRWIAAGMLSSDGYFCDPQLGCSNRLVAEDLSEEHSWQLSQEFRLASHFSGPLNFSVGGNYMHYETHENYYVFINTLTLLAAEWGGHSPSNPYVGGVTDNFNCLVYGAQAGNPAAGASLANCIYIDPNPISSLNSQGHNYFLSQNPYTLNSFAGFGEIYYDLFKDLKLTGGLRWTEDRQHFPLMPSWLVAAQSFGYPVAGVVDQQWDQLTGRAAINWTPQLSFTDQTLVYGSYAHGYKAGGANPPVPVSVDVFGGRGTTSVVHPLTFEPEFIDAFEIGSKNTLLDGALTLNASAFYYNYENYQISEIVDRTAINRNFDAHVKGAELEATYEPVPGLRFNFSSGYEDARIAKGEKAIDLMDRTAGTPGWMVVKPYPTVPSNCVQPIAEVAKVIGASILGLCRITADYDLSTYDPTNASNNNEGFYKDLSHNEMPNAPPWTLSFGAQYSTPITQDWAGTLRTDVYWQSNSYWRVFNDLSYDKLQGYSNVNLTLILTNQAGWQVMLYDKNIFDKTAISGAFLNSDDSGLTTNVFLTDPKLIGIRVTKNW